MKRLIVALAVVAGLAAGAMLVRNRINPEAIASEIVAVLGAGTEGGLTLRGAAELVLLPRPAVLFRNAVVERPGAVPAVVASADCVSAVLDLWSLMFGRISVADIVVDHPRMVIQGAFSLAGLTPDAGWLRRLLPANVTIHDGEVEIHDALGGRVETISRIEATIHWPRASSGASLGAAFVWRSMPIKLAVQGSSPLRLAEAIPGSLDVLVSSGSSSLGFGGKALLTDRLQLDGAFSLALTRPGDWADLIGRVRFGPVFAQAVEKSGPLRVDGRLRSLGWSGTVSDVRMVLDGARADGVLSLQLDSARPQVRGTLAFDRVDLTTGLSRLPLDRWRDWRLDPAWLTWLDLDLRLSFGEIDAYDLELSHLAAALLVTNGQLHAEVSDTGLLGGTASLILRGAPQGDGIKTNGRLSLVGTSAPPTLALFGLARGPVERGTLSILGDFEAEGSTLGEVAKTLRGRANAEALRLVLTSRLGLTTVQTPLRSNAPVLLGNAILDSARADLDFVGPLLTLRRFEAESADVRLQLAGTVSLASGALALVGGASVPAAETALVPGSVERRVVPIQVSGSLDKPIAVAIPSQRQD